MKKASIFLIPTFLSDTEPKNVFPGNNAEIIAKLNIFIVENIRTARRFLRKVGYQKNFDTEVKFYLLDKHTNIFDLNGFLKEVTEGENIGLLSEAGTPCIADPGAKVVELAHEKGIRVVPLTGPNSIILALMASGFNGQNFAFHGYLPIEKAARKQKLLALEQSVFKDDQTQIFIETPFRNQAMFDSIIQHCSNRIKLCIASDLTGKNEEILSKPISYWKKHKPNFHKIPTVFLLYK
jgi:16S rRNA (cytidine1402-2'-O)-methyltransferase